MKSIFFLAASLALVQARCPLGTKPLEGKCYRATEAKAQATAVTLCNKPGESLVSGQDVELFNKVKALFLATGGGTGGSGNGGPGKFFWTADTTSAPPLCMAGWSRSPDYVPEDCGKFYPALCQVNECSISIESSDTPYSSQFKAENVLTNQCDAFTNPSTYFLLPDTIVNQGFVLDLQDGCQGFNQMQIKNTHNTQHNDRGTKDYTLSVSDSPTGPFTNFYNGVLANAANLGCNVPTFTIDFNQVYTERYVKVTLNSHYPHVHSNPNVVGAGLQYINFLRN